MAFFRKSFAKVATWLIRILQVMFSLILIGVCAYMLREFNRFGYRSPQEVVVPLLFSCIALFVSFWSLIAVCCLPYYLQILAAVLDFATLSGFIASVVLLKDNFHTDATKNPLRGWLIYVRLKNNESPREAGNGALVSLLVALCVLMIITFFITSLLSCLVAMLSHEEHVEKYGHGHPGMMRGGEGTGMLSDVEGGTATEITTVTATTVTEVSQVPKGERRVRMTDVATGMIVPTSAEAPIQPERPRRPGTAAGARRGSRKERRDRRKARREEAAGEEISGKRRAR